MKNMIPACACVRQTSWQTGSQRGVALVTALLLLTLLSAVTVGMVLAASSDELTSGYYRNMRGSFYAADSGLTIARTAMLNSLSALVPVSITNRATPPISTNSTTASTIVSSINSTYGASLVSLNAGQAAGSWPAKYRLSTADTALTLVDCRPTGGTGVGSNCTTVCAGGGTACAANITGYSYTYTYAMKVVGQSRASEATTLTDRGNLLVNINFNGGSATPTSFAAWGFFVDNFDLCGSLTLVPGTVTGPAHSNEAWTFGTSGSYIFTDPLTAVNANLGYRFSSGCYSSPNDPYVRSGSGGGTIDPNFQAGYSLGQNPIALPTDSFSQKRAVLDGQGTNNTDPSSAEMGAVLRNGLPAASSYSGSSGVYLPYTCSGGAGCPTKTMAGGGVYIEGNASVTLATLTGNGQRYTIVQGSTTTVVDVMPSTGTTTIKVGTNATQTITGVPVQKDSGGNVLRNATMLYVNGNMSSLKGVVNNTQAITAVANGNVVITDDITYVTKPVTTSQNQIPGTPPATLIPGNDNGQVLGIYTSDGNIQLNNSGNSTLDVQASLAALRSGGSNTIENIGSSISTLNIMGGRIQNNMGNINTSTRNIYFDRRFSQGGFAPPWFPSTTVTPVGPTSTLTTPTTSRVQWLNQTPF